MKIETKEVKSIAISEYSMFENDKHKYNLYATEWINGEGMDVTLESDSDQIFSLSSEDIIAINKAAEELGLV